MLEATSLRGVIPMPFLGPPLVATPNKQTPRDTPSDLTHQGVSMPPCMI